MVGERLTEYPSDTPTFVMFLQSWVVQFFTTSAFPVTTSPSGLTNTALSRRLALNHVGSLALKASQPNWCIFTRASVLADLAGAAAGADASPGLFSAFASSFFGASLFSDFLVSSAFLSSALGAAAPGTTMGTSPCQMACHLSPLRV